MREGHHETFGAEFEGSLGRSVALGVCLSTQLLSRPRDPRILQKPFSALGMPDTLQSANFC